MSVKISELQSSSTLDGTEQIPLVQNGTTKKVSVSNLGFPFTGTASIDGALNIDFTETLDFVTKEDFSVNYGELFIPGPGWIQVIGDGPGIATIFENADALIQQGVFDLEFDPGFGILPIYFAGELYEIKSGSYEGTVLSNGVIKSPGNFVDSDFSARIKNGSDNREYIINTSINQAGGSDGLTIRKTNETGENINLFTTDLQTGFVLANTLSDASASLFKFLDNNDDTLFEVRNDGLFVGPNIPTADPLVAGQIWSNNGVLTISAGTP